MTTDSRANRDASLKPYIALLQRVFVGDVTLADFKRDFFEMFKADDTMWAEAEYKLLNNLFLDLDEYSVDPELRDPGVLGESQITTIVSRTLEGLEAREQERDLSANG